MLRFEWDEAKNLSNMRKHGVSFETASRVFADPFAMSEQDRIERGEKRGRTIGLIEGFFVLVVAHTVFEEGDDETEVIRIISARKATPRERRRYENEGR